MNTRTKFPGKYSYNHTSMVVWFVLMSALLFLSCAPTRNLNNSLSMESASKHQTFQFDSVYSRLEKGVQRFVKDLREEFSKRNIEKERIVYFPPDSTGKQAVASKETFQENSTTVIRKEYDEEFAMLIQMSYERIGRIEQKLDSMIYFKTLEHIDQVSQTTSYKELVMTITICTCVLVILGMIVFASIRKRCKGSIP